MLTTEELEQKIEDWHNRTSVAQKNTIKTGQIITAEEAKKLMRDNQKICMESVNHILSYIEGKIKDSCKNGGCATTFTYDPDINNETREEISTQLCSLGYKCPLRSLTGTPETILISWKED